MKKSIFLIILLLSSIIIRAQDTYLITGTLKDAKGISVQGATIFLSGSNKMTATNERGEFRIGPLQPGTYELVVKMLGFDPYSQVVTLQQKSIEVSIVIKESSIALNAVVIRGAPDPNRPEYLKFFTEYFIGKSANASRCKMLNPEVLSLRYNKLTDVLVASTEEFLSIENRALGYKVNYLISNFKLDFRNKLFAYEGSSYFEDLPGSEAQKKQWEQNRTTAYEGSIRHFFRSAFTNSSEFEGFLVYQLPEKQVLNQLTKKELLTIEPVNITSLLFGINKDFKDLKLNNVPGLYVIYTREKEQSGFYGSNEHINFPLKLATGENQISFIRPLASNIQVDKNGGLTPTRSFMYEGYWSYERVADLMPLDYVNNPAK